MPLTPTAAADLATTALLPSLLSERTRLDRIDRWYRWDHDAPHRPRQATREYEDLSQRAQAPWLGKVVTSVAQVLYVDGYRQADDLEDATPWAWWQANGLDARQIAVHRAALAYGLAYLTVLPGENPLTGESAPVIRGVSPRKMMAFYEDPAEDDWPLYAVRVDSARVNDQDGWRVRVYDDVSVHELVAAADGTKVEHRSSFEHRVGVCPVVRVVNTLDLEGRATGEVEPFIPIAACIDQTKFDRLVVQRFSSWVVRTIAGMAKPEDGAEAATAALKMRVEDLLVAEDADTKFGSLPATPLGGFIDAYEADIRTLAAVSQTPSHEMLGQMANLPLALDTPVPTTSGTKTMGTLAVGDQVFTPNGTATPVIGLSPVYENRVCYRISFDDGTSVVADADHEWVASCFRDAERPYRRIDGVRRADRVTRRTTTAEMAGSVETKLGTRNWFMDLAAPFDAPSVELPVNPYALGVWLGDGCHTTGTVTAHRDDAPLMVANLQLEGQVVLVREATPGDHTDARRTITVSYDRGCCPRGHTRPRGTRTVSARCVTCASLFYLARRDGTAMPPRSNMSFVARLKAAGVWKAKHIPESYFVAPFKDRLALLQGLMDTDGTVNRSQGSVKLALHNERLARDAHRLIQSLGHRVRLVEKTANHKRFGPARVWAMTWSALDPVFRLPRKLLLQRDEFGGGDGLSNTPHRRYVASVDRVESVPVRCITVADESHMFCVTEAFVPTCNSAEALAAAESSLNRKVEERKHLFGEAWEQALRLSAHIMGDEAAAADTAAEVRWRDMESRSLAQAADALGKLAQMLNVPVQVLWEKIPGWTQTDVERAKALAAEGGSMDQMLAELAGGQTSAPVTADPAETKAKADSLGILIRAGVSAESAASIVGLSGATFTGAVPVSLRLPETDAAGLEE